MTSPAWVSEVSEVLNDRGGVRVRMYTMKDQHRSILSIFKYTVCVYKSHLKVLNYNQDTFLHFKSSIKTFSLSACQVSEQGHIQ